MPAVSENQAVMFQIAEAIKKGKLKKSYSKAATDIAKTLSAKKIEEFTHE